MNTVSLAKRIKLNVLKMCYESHSSHIGSCLSCADILAVLYNDVLKREERFIMSKGHAAAALYAALAETGRIPKKALDTYCQNGGTLSGHVSYGVSGVEVSTGSLGHGLSIACGMAKANSSSRVFVLMGDGECDEGSVWEAALFAAHHKLGNLTAIVDWNRIQSFGAVSEVLGLEPFVTKWQAFGWRCVLRSGHDFQDMQSGLELPDEGSPLAILAVTVKGKSVSLLENTLLSHYVLLTDEQYHNAVKEIEGC